MVLVVDWIYFGILNAEFSVESNGHQEVLSSSIEVNSDYSFVGIHLVLGAIPDLRVVVN